MTRYETLLEVISVQGRRMAAARALLANGMKPNQVGKPIIAVVNSFTQFVPDTYIYTK